MDSKVKLAGNEVVVDAAEAMMPHMARRGWLNLIFKAVKENV